MDLKQERQKRATSIFFSHSLWLFCCSPCRADDQPLPFNITSLTWDGEEKKGTWKEENKMSAVGLDNFFRAWTIIKVSSTIDSYLRFHSALFDQHLAILDRCPPIPTGRSNKAGEHVLKSMNRFCYSNPPPPNF